MVLPEFLDRMNASHPIEYRYTCSFVVDKVLHGNTYCAICSRLRRDNFYRVASEEECSLFGLGTHRDYILETFFLNLFNGSYLGKCQLNLKITKAIYLSIDHLPMSMRKIAEKLRNS